MHVALRFAFAVGLVAGVSLASGCVKSRVYVLDAATTSSALTPTRTIALRQGDHSITLSDKEIERFETALTSAHRDQSTLKESVVLGSSEQATSDLILQYRFVSLDTGDAPVRVVSGIAGLFGSPFYALGDGDIGVEATYLDAQNHQLARILCNGPISGMFAGRGDGLDAAALSVAKFTAKHFPAALPETPLSTTAP